MDANTSLNIGLSLYPKNMIPTTPYNVNPITADDGILDYVREVAAERFPQRKNSTGMFLPDFSEVFRHIYNNGWIDERGKEEFLADDLIQNVINLRNLDGEKLWMLCLWTRNYVETTFMTSFQPSPLKEMEAIADSITETYKRGNQIKITATSTNRTCIAKTENTETAILIRDAICRYLEEIMDGDDWKEESVPDNDDRTLKQFLDAKYQYYIYDTILEGFLKTRKRRSGTRSVSNDLKQITGHTIFYVGLVCEINLLIDPSYLKGQLSGVGKDTKSKVFTNQVYHQKDRIAGGKIISTR